MKQILYTNIDIFSDENMEDVAEGLFGEYAEEEGWESINDVPEDMIIDVIRDQDEFAWDDAGGIIKKFLATPFIWTGYETTWRARYNGYIITYDSDDIFGSNGLLKDCDDVEISDDNGYLCILGYHHDGEVNFKGKMLTDKGIEKVEDNYDIDYRVGYSSTSTDPIMQRSYKIVDKLFNSSTYSVKPNIFSKYF